MEDNVTVLPGQAEETLYSDVCQIINGTRGRIATFLNTEVCMTNWYIGKRIKEDVLFNQRAEYGTASRIWKTSDKESFPEAHRSIRVRME